jgi:hypothetical protein
VAVYAYRTETVQKVYEAIVADVWLAERIRTVVKDNKSSRIKQLVFRAPADFQYISVKTGDNDSGVIFGIQNFSDEQGDVPRDVQRTAEIYVDIAYNPNVQNVTADEDRDEIEGRVLGAIAAMGRTEVPGLVGMSYRRRQRITATVGNNPSEVSRITLQSNYIIDGDDTFPDAE